MQQAMIDEQIAAYLSGHLSADAREELLHWVEASVDNKAYFDEAVSIWALADSYDVAVEVETDLAWDKFKARIDLDQDVAPAVASTPEAKTIDFKSRKRIPNYWFGIAASLLFLLSFAWWWNYGDRTISVQTIAQETRKIELPDGSEVWLNQDSRLVYNGRFESRELSLTGEAFFDVVPDADRPFLIHTEKATTRVLGTSFNVRAYPDEENVEVTVSTGKVALLDQDEPEDRIELEVGETGVFLKEEDKVQTEVIENVNATAWKEQKLIFGEESLRGIIPTINRYFDVNIEVDDERLLDCSIILGEYDNPELEPILAAISFSLDWDLESSPEDKQYIFSGPLCD